MGPGAPHPISWSEHSTMPSRDFEFISDGGSFQGPGELWPVFAAMAVGLVIVFWLVRGRNPGAAVAVLIVGAVLLPAIKFAEDILGFHHDFSVADLLDGAKGLAIVINVMWLPLALAAFGLGYVFRKKPAPLCETICEL